jgi:hypothetical protein
MIVAISVVPRIPITSAPGTRRALDDDARVDEADDRDEEAYADPDRELDVVRYRVDHRLAEADEHEQGDDQALGDDDAHRVGPAQAIGADQREGDERVDAQARGERERVAPVDAHRQRGDARDQGGHGQHLVERELHTARRRHRSEDLRVDEEDVGHRQERGHAGPHLGGDRGPPCGHIEELVQPRRERRTA